MAYGKGDPRNGREYRFRVGARVLVTSRFTREGRSTREGRVTRQFLPLREARPQIVGVPAGGGEVVVLSDPALANPRAGELRYAVKVEGFRQFEVFEGDLAPAEG